MSKTGDKCCVCSKEIEVNDGKVDGCHLYSKKYGKLHFCAEHNQGGFMKQLSLYRKALKESIEYIKKKCHCGYCKFCIDYGIGSEYIQVYKNKSPITAGKTMSEAKAEYEHIKPLLN